MSLLRLGGAHGWWQEGSWGSGCVRRAGAQRLHPKLLFWEVWGQFMLYSCLLTLHQAHSVEAIAQYPLSLGKRLSSGESRHWQRKDSHIPCPRMGHSYTLFLSDLGTAGMVPGETSTSPPLLEPGVSTWHTHQPTSSAPASPSCLLKVSSLMGKRWAWKRLLKAHAYFKGKSRGTPLNLIHSSVSAARDWIMKRSELLRRFQSKIGRYKIKCFSPWQNLHFLSSFLSQAVLFRLPTFVCLSPQNGMGGHIAKWLRTDLSRPRVPAGIWFLTLTGCITSEGTPPARQDEKIQDPGDSDKDARVGVVWGEWSTAKHVNLRAQVLSGKWFFFVSCIPPPHSFPTCVETIVFSQLLTKLRLRKASARRSGQQPGLAFPAPAACLPDRRSCRRPSPLSNGPRETGLLSPHLHATGWKAFINGLCTVRTS